jgi:2-keto-4-pentenoate hydratase/2-oxohepta-3-ene-1,7-dioic acid hydratase in catechol pathway
MRLVTYSKDNSICCGLLVDGGIVDICANWQGADAPRSVLEILQRGQDCIEKIGKLSKTAIEKIPLDSVKLLAPIPRPGKVLALAGNYAEHIEEAGLALGLSDSPRDTTVPRSFLMPSTAVIGPGEIIPWPVYSDKIDYELELAVVIGKTAKCIGIDDAIDYVAGYTITNDVSARSVTFSNGRTKRPWDEFYDWLNGKWADGFCPMGPFLATKDEIEDVQNLDMCLTVNGEVRQQANTTQVIYKVADIISFLSHLMTLEPGDCVCTGTPSGVAMATGRFLQPGDVIECTIESLGTLTNTLGNKPAFFYSPLAGS